MANRSKYAGGDHPWGQEGPYRLLFDRNPQPMWVYDSESLAFLAVNEAAVNHYGYSTAEFLRMSIKDIRPAQDVPALLERVSQEVEKLQRRHRRKDGTIIDVEVTTKDVEWKGRAARLVSVADVTEREQAEERLRQSEESYRRLIEQSPDALLVHRQGTIVFANASCAALFGAAGADELLGKQYLELVHPNDRDGVKQRIEKFSHEGVHVRRNETRFLRLDGQDIHLEVAARSVNYQGEPAIQVVCRDISERKQTEKKLRQSEANLSAAQAIAHLGNWTWDPINDVLTWSAEMFRIYGVSPEKFEPTLASVMKLIHPDDLARHEKCVFEMLAGNPVDTFEYRIVRPDGSERVLQALGGAVDRDNTGLPLRISGVVLDVTERRKVEERFYKAFSANPQPITIATIAEGRYIDVNESFVRVTGYQREQVIGHTALELNFWVAPADRDKLVGLLNTQGSVRDLEITFRTKSGKIRTALDSAEVIEIAGQKCILAIFDDITDRKVLEKQLYQAQKMEAVGRLSGGIAHDFNNLLSVIIGYSDTLEEALDESGKVHKQATEIRKAAQRAAALTRQLLAFSRQQAIEPKVFDLNDVVVEMEKMLERLIGEDIELRAVLSPAPVPVRADPGQIEQVIMNLAVNARDAMPHGGKLTIETANVEVDETYAHQHGYLSTGPFVMLSISDTGVGMDAQTQSHIFEPFFTTKDRGKGTGLGLATVYGVIKQSNGFIWVYSEPGHGATFKVLLPRVKAPVPSASANTKFQEVWRGSQTILLVEDDDSLRDLTRDLLVNCGYTVLEASNGPHALQIARQRSPGQIHLLLTDVVMPRVSGPQLATQFAALHPDAKVLLMSGYTEFAAGHDQISQQEWPLLQKPFTKRDLARKVREALETSSAPPVSPPR